MWERGVHRSLSVHQPPHPYIVVSGVPGLGLSLAQVEVYRQPSRRWEEGGGGVASLLARVKPNRGEGVRIHRSESLALQGKVIKSQPLVSSVNEEAKWKKRGEETRGDEGRGRDMQTLHQESTEYCKQGNRREKLRRAKSLPGRKQRERVGKVRTRIRIFFLQESDIT